MPEPSLNITDTEGVTVVGFQDNAILDTLTIQRLGHELYTLAEEPRSQQLLIDFHNIRFLSSQALGVLLTLRRKADKSGVEVVFARLRPELVRVFQITNLDKMFRFFDSHEEALAHFGVKPQEE